MNPATLLQALGVLALQANTARNKYRLGSPIWQYHDGRLFAYRQMQRAIREATHTPQPQPEAKP